MRDNDRRCHLSLARPSNEVMIPLQNASLTQGEPLTDEDVVERIRAGDAALFEILMRRHNQRVYRTVRAVLGADDDVEDVMQQAYLNAFMHLHQFEGRAQFSTWLTRIAVNEALARRGKRASRFGEQEETMLELIESNAPDPEKRAVAAEMREVMQREVAALPDRFRLVVMLRDVEGLTTAETAACLEVSEDLVKTRLHRARAILRANLYKRAGVTLESLFAFGNARCDRVVASVMARLSRV
jgi:RNA polymerase sigma-70 factor, ECF subfamily